MDNKVVRDLQNLTYLSWDKIRHSSGTAGSFLKAYDELSGRKTYYKLSNYNSLMGIIGHESINEIIVDRLLTLLGIPHLEYSLIYSEILLDNNIYKTYLCSSKDFKEKGESKISFETFYQIERLDKESVIQFCERMGWSNYIYQMLIVDFLILNRDRHGANIEVLRNKKERTLRLAPLFDHGLSLLFSCHDIESINNFNVMDDKKIQSFVGYNSALENLKLIPKGKCPKLNALKPEDKEYLFYNLDDIIPNDLIDKIWEMIWRRWTYYESICD